jgi:hypothetical protein
MSLYENLMVSPKLYLSVMNLLFPSESIAYKSTPDLPVAGMWFIAKAPDTPYLTSILSAFVIKCIASPAEFSDKSHTLFLTKSSARSGSL